MISAVMDTSSLISLEMIGALRKSIGIVKIYVPAAIKGELEELAKYKDKEGKAAESVLNLIKDKSMKLVGIKNSQKVDSLLSKDVSRGEAECFMCCVENNIKLLVIDDVDAAYRLEGMTISNDIKMKISVSVLVELYKKKLINKDQLKKYIENMIKIREWEGGVLEVLADKYLKNL